MTKTEVDDVVGSCVVNLRGLKTKNHFLIKNYLSMKTRNVLMKIEWQKLQDNSQEVAWFWLGKRFFTSDYVAMIGHGCDVFQYPQFYYQHLETYQLLPRPYLGSFEGDNEEILIKWRKITEHRTKLKDMCPQQSFLAFS